MVYYSRRAQKDFERLFISLLKWKRKGSLNPVMSYGEVIGYRAELYAQPQNLDTATYHEKPRYADHKKYGKHVLTYLRSDKTTWYFIYDIKPNGDILVKKIMNNYATTSGAKKKK